MKITMIKEVRTGYKFSVVEELEEREISEEFYKNTTSNETLKFFRKTGGYEKAEKNYTCRGYNTTKLISINPTKTKKIIRTFKFE